VCSLIDLNTLPSEYFVPLESTTRWFELAQTQQQMIGSLLTDQGHVTLKDQFEEIKFKLECLQEFGKEYALDLKSMASLPTARETDAGTQQSEGYQGSQIFT
jgi:hypothetical protein